MTVFVLFLQIWISNCKFLKITRIAIDEQFCLLWI